MLWALNEAANAHKHQGLVRLDTGTSLGNVDMIGGLVKLLLPPRWDGPKQEIECGTFIKGSKIEGNIEVGMFIAFNEIEVIGGEPVSRVLDHFIQVAEHIISSLEAKGVELGFLK